jgi:hypothetical protein
MARKVAPQPASNASGKKPRVSGARATARPAAARPAMSHAATSHAAASDAPPAEIATEVAPAEAVNDSAAATTPAKPATGAGAVASALVADPQPAQITTLGMQLLDDRPTTSTQAARVLEEVLAQKPALLVPLIDRFVLGILGENPRVVQTCAAALPAMARLAPARVARHLPSLTESFHTATPAGRDGLVRTFAALCSASVAYQKRLEPVLDIALGQAEARSLVTWTEIVLPALKGEPHARARSVVERRVYELPRPLAQKLADFLGIKLRRISP